MSFYHGGAPQTPLYRPLSSYYCVSFMYTLIQLLFSESSECPEGSKKAGNVDNFDQIKLNSGGAGIK